MRRGLTLGVLYCGLVSLVPLALAALLGAGCSSSDPSGDSGDPDADAAQPTIDGSNPSLDAGADVADARDAAKEAAPVDQRYCTKLSPAPKFCDDFDDGDLTNNWDVPIMQNALIDIDDSTSASSPFSFIAETPKQTGQTSSNAALRKTVLGAVSHVTLAFSALFPAVTFDKGIVSIATLDVSSNHYFTLNLRDDDMTTPGPSLQEFVGGTMTRHVFTKVPAIGVWTRITIDLDFGTGKANVTFGAEKALDAEPITAMPGTEATIRIGAVYLDGPADAFTGNFDDVVVNF